MAALCSLALDLPLWLAGRLGYYDNDFNHLTLFWRGPYSLHHSTANLARYLLNDEPLFNVYHGLRYRLLGAPALPHHLLLGVLFAANAVLAFLFVRRLSQSGFLSFSFLLFFLTWPNRGEALYWPAAVYVVMLLYLLIALHLFLSWLEHSSVLTLAGSWFFCSLAIWTHETASAFPGIFLILWLLYREREDRHNKSPRWREGVLVFAPFALSSAAYLTVRLTRWFGHAERTFLFDRRLTPGSILPNFVYSLRLTFGPAFVHTVSRLIREDAAGWGAGTVPGKSLAALFAIGWTALAAGGLILLVAGLAEAGRSQPGSDPGPRAVLRLAVLGGAWILFAYAPTYVFLIFNRHTYVPSVGSSLLAALALWLLMRRAERLGRLARLGPAGLACGLMACFCIADLGEAAKWTEASRFTSRLHEQLAAAWPSLPRDARVVILDVPDTWKGVPLLPPYALDAALAFWYHRPPILSYKSFYPQREFFQFHAGPKEPRQPYPYLLLFRFHGQQLTPVRRIAFENGEKVALGAAFHRDPRDQPAIGNEDAALEVTVNRMVR